MHALFMQMPAPIISFVEQIEAAAGNEIELERNPGGAAALPRNPPLIQYADHFQASSEVYLSPCGIMAHEILHLFRWFALGVPLVFPQVLRWPDGRAVNQDDPMPGDDPWSVHLLRVESCLEHLVIEPRLRGLGFKVDYASSYRAFWVDPPSNRGGIPDRWNLLMAYLQTRFVVDNRGLLSRAENHLRSVGLLDVARGLEAMFSRLLSSPDPAAAKLGMILAFFTAVGVPPAALRIAYAPKKEIDSKLQPMPDSIAVPMSNGPALQLGSRMYIERSQTWIQ